MKKGLLALTACIALFTAPAFASFPVTSGANDAEQKEISTLNENIEIMSEQWNNEVSGEEGSVLNSMTQAADSDREMWITVALWFFLGAFAAHRWYRKKPTGWNILFILTAGGCGVWAIVDLINILTGKF